MPWHVHEDFNGLLVTCCGLLGCNLMGTLCSTMSSRLHLYFQAALANLTSRSGRSGTCQVGPQEVQLLLSKQGIQALHNVHACAYAENADSCNERPYELVSMVPIGVQGSRRLVGLHDARPQESLHNYCNKNAVSHGHAPAPSRLGHQMQPGLVK